MHSPLFAIADIWLNNRQAAIFYLCISPIALLFLSGAIYKDFKSHRRQGKRWVWFKRPSIISTISILFWLIACIFFYGAGFIKFVPDTSLTIIPIRLTLLAGVALAIYSIILSSQEKNDKPDL